MKSSWLVLALLLAALPAHGQEIGDGKFDLKAVPEQTFKSGKLTVHDVYVIGQVQERNLALVVQVVQPKTVGSSRSCGTLDAKLLRLIVNGLPSPLTLTVPDPGIGELAAAAAFMAEHLDGWVLAEGKGKRIGFHSDRPEGKAWLALDGNKDTVAVLLGGNPGEPQAQFSDLKSVKDILRLLRRIPQAMQAIKFDECF